MSLPDGSITADNTFRRTGSVETSPCEVWFPQAHLDAFEHEMKLRCDNFGDILTLLYFSEAKRSKADRGTPSFR